jgi:hypothetical protein
LNLTQSVSIFENLLEKYDLSDRVFEERLG